MILTAFVHRSGKLPGYVNNVSWGIRKWHVGVRAYVRTSTWIRAMAPGREMAKWKVKLQHPELPQYS